MILWVFIKFFGVKIVITNIYRYFTDIYRFFTDFFLEIHVQVHVLHSRDFSVEKSVFSDFSAKNQRFYRFFPNFSFDRFFLCFFFLVPAENRFFGDISAQKNDFLFPDHDMESNLEMLVFLIWGEHVSSCFSGYALA